MLGINSPGVRSEGVTTELAALRRVADMHAVYRMFDPGGRLLYVGMTGDAGQRFGDHAGKRWFPQVETIKLEWFPHKAAARVAEQRAIRTERPRHNVAGKRSRAPRPAPDIAPILQDILAVLEPGEDRVWSCDVVQRLAALRPERYAGWDASALGKALREYGVKTRQTWLREANRRGGANRQGIARIDLIAQRGKAAAQ